MFVFLSIHRWCRTNRNWAALATSSRIQSTDRTELSFLPSILSAVSWSLSNTGAKATNAAVMLWRACVARVNSPMVSHRITNLCIIPTCWSLSLAKNKKGKQMCQPFLYYLHYSMLDLRFLKETFFFFISTWLEKRSRYSEFISHVYTVSVNIKWLVLRLFRNFSCTRGWFARLPWRISETSKTSTRRITFINEARLPEATREARSDTRSVRVDTDLEISYCS